MSANHHDAFIHAMLDAGLEMEKPYLETDGRLHRFRVVGDKAGSSNGWYVLHLDAKPFGAFGSWKTGHSQTWTAEDPQTLSAADRAALHRRMAEVKAARDTELRNVQTEAAARSVRLWQRAKPANNDHPYLQRKRVSSFGLRDLRGQLVVPVRNERGELCSLQFIGADGRKTFLTGGRKRGCYHAIGRPERVICIAEGYATAATLYQATGFACVVAFDAGNLLPVAKVIRGKFPRINLCICADNDWQTPGNPGLTAATAAARAVGAAMAVPSFPEVPHVRAQ